MIAYIVPVKELDNIQGSEYQPGSFFAPYTDLDGVWWISVEEVRDANNDYSFVREYQTGEPNMPTATAIW